MLTVKRINELVKIIDLMESAKLALVTCLEGEAISVSDFEQLKIEANEKIEAAKFELKMGAVLL